MAFGDHVVYNGGEGKARRLAHLTDVTELDDGGALGTLVITGEGGQQYIEVDVPRRSPADYDDADPPGGGHTWHYDEEA